MAIVAASTSDSQQKLMQALGEAITAHTLHSPMAIDEIVSVLGFCAGAAIVSGCKSHGNRKKMRNLVAANVDHGMETMSGMGSGLIIPGVTH